MTRKAHLKISKVSVDFLIPVLMAVSDSRLVLTPLALDDSKKKRFQQRGRKSCPAKSFFLLPEQQNVSSNIEKSNYLECLGPEDKLN